MDGMASPVERLRQAAAAGHVDQVRDLCKAGAKMDPDLEGRTALHLASANGHVATVKTLIDAGAKVNVRDAAGYSPLHQAATEGHEEVVLLLLQNGCHVDTQDELHGNTALHEAAWKGYSRTVEVLCKQRANIYIKNHGGFTPLHLTCQNGHNQSCRILLLSACKPDIRNSYGDTALHTAARYGHAGVLRILISAFCCVSETNKNGDTALHISTAMGRRKLTKILLEAGCDQKIKNNQGETARDIAERKEYNEVVDLLDNPPVTLIPVLENEKCPLKTPKSVGKKREKDSGTSQESSKEKKEKHKKSKKGHKVHFSPTDTKKGNVSPYGCHMYPNLEYFPSVKLKSLPPEPLKRGEQYYADLAGNIKKGPTGLGYMCYCAPFFNHVEKKLDANKKELLTHIDNKNEDLKAKITHLEQRTHDQLFSLNQKMKESLALERTECSERMDRRILRERHELQSQQESSVQSLRSDMKSWMNSEKTLTNGHNSLGITRCQMQNNLPLARSKSADLLSESDSHQWSTDLQSDSHGLTLCQQSKNCNGFDTYQDFRHRLYVNAKNCGTRPKYDTRMLPKISKLKAKYDHPVLTRDSRSEGDLTSCHTVTTDNVPYKPTSPVRTVPKGACNLNILDRNSMKYNLSTNYQPNHVHYQPIKNNYTVNNDSPGVLWNRNRFVVNNSPKNGTLLGKQENEYVQTKGLQNAQNFLTKSNQEKNHITEPSITPEQKPHVSFPNASVVHSRISVNYTGKRHENLNNNVLTVEPSVTNLPSYQISTETTGRPIEPIAMPIQTDGSSFV